MKLHFHQLDESARKLVLILKKVLITLCTTICYETSWHTNSQIITASSKLDTTGMPMYSHLGRLGWIDLYMYIYLGMLGRNTNRAF